MSSDPTIKGVSLAPSDGAGLNVVIVHTRWNKQVIDALVEGTVNSLKSCGVTSIRTVDVPGSYELPYACQSLLKHDPSIDAVIAIGCLIKGETMHFEYIADATSHGLMKAQLDIGKPIVFGVLTCLTEEQAKARAGLTPNGHNHGYDWGITAVEMARVQNKLKPLA